MIFESKEDIPWTLDGEFGGTHKTVQLLNQKQAVDIKIKNDNF
jgi:hypothetical protein